MWLSVDLLIMFCNSFSQEFSRYGRVKSCRVVQDIVTGISRGYGFVEFKKEADAQNAWKHAHMSVFHERQILVEWEFARTLPGWIPRRLGLFLHVHQYLTYILILPHSSF